MRTQRFGGWLAASLALAAPAAAADGFWYSDSKGRRVDLQLAPDRLVVVPAPALWQGAGLPPGVAGLDRARPRAGGLWELSLEDAQRGRQIQAAREMVKRRLAQRAGLVFQTPAGGTFTLDRGVLLRLANLAALKTLAGLGLDSCRPQDAAKEVWLCDARDAEAALAAARKASGLPGVDWALPDFGAPIELFRSVNDTYFSQQWHLAQTSDCDIDADEGWDVTMGDQQVIIAIVDTGVDTGHPEFAGRMVAGYNAVTDGSDPTPLDLSLDAHGTSCAGAALAGADNGVGVAGVCPNCTLMPIKMMDGLADDAQLSRGYRAIDYAAEHGAWVISNSWGIDEQYIGQIDIQPYYTAVQNAVNNGRGGKGAVVLFASGNGNQMGQAQPIGTHELQNQTYVMAVGGSGPEDLVVSYSDYGPNLSVVAPTGKINAISQNPFDGPQIVTTDTRGNAGFSRGGYYYTINPWTGQDMATDIVEIDSGGDYTKYFNGTSAACPIAAGTIGLVLSANPQLTGAEARLIVEQTADKIGGVAYDADGHHEKYGFGRINAGRAVRTASFGLHNPDGAACVEDINCQSGACHLAGGSGTCITPCTTAADCPAGQTCEDLGDGTLACSARCDSDADCTAPALCLPDGSDSRCQAIACPQATCPAGTACPLQGGYCERTCSSDADCSGGELCLPGSGGNVCQSISCSDGSECPSGSACPVDGGTCQRTCSSDDDCQAAALCLPAGGGSLCQQVACTSADDCPEGTECGEEGFCLRPGGGGCGCAATRPSKVFSLFVFLALGLLILSRKTNN